MSKLNKNNKESKDVSKNRKRRILGLKKNFIHFIMSKRNKNNKMNRIMVKPRIYLDGSFLFHCFIHKMDIRNINKMFKGVKFEIATTDCTWKELSWYVNQLTEHNIRGIYYSMKDQQVSTITCGHKDSMHAKNCIMSLIGENNKNTAMVASHDTVFLQKLSENPLIPVVVIEGGDFTFNYHGREFLCFQTPASADPDEDEDEERLMERMKLYEFEHVKVVGDGNCLLRALSEQITHDENKHGILRELLAGQIQCNEELYKEHVQKFMARHPEEFRQQPTYSYFVEYFLKDGNMAPFFITVQAASDFFKAKIVSISSEEKAVFREFTPHDMDDPQTVWYLSVLATEVGHTDSVYPRRTPSKSCRHLYDLNTLSMVIEEDSS